MCCVEVGVTVAELTRPRHSRSLCLAWGGVVSLPARWISMVQRSDVGFSHSSLLTTFSLVLAVTLITVCFAKSSVFCVLIACLYIISTKVPFQVFGLFFFFF